MTWRVHHVAETTSTNFLAREGEPGEVWSTDSQTAGRGRLDHVWHAARGSAVMLSAVIDITALPLERVPTLTIAVGVAVLRTVKEFATKGRLELKWPNDVWVDKRKIAGILCEQHGTRAIIGIGLNVFEGSFPADLAARATSLALQSSQHLTCAAVEEKLLFHLNACVMLWKKEGLSAFASEIAAVDALKGRFVEIRQMDDDPEPLKGICRGIAPDGTLIVGDKAIYAGEAHVLSWN